MFVKATFFWGFVVWILDAADIPNGNHEVQGKITGNLKTAPVQQHNHSLSLNNTAKAPPTLPIKQRSKPATKDIDPDAVQCLFFENGSVECLPECSIREVQVSVNSGMQSIWMRECAKNRAPIRHTWQINDGVMLASLGPIPQKDRKQDLILAACIFAKDGSYSCEQVTSCRSANTADSGGCHGRTSWTGSATGDPLSEGAALKEKVDSTGNLDVAGSFESNEVEGSNTASDDSFYDPNVIQCKYMDNHDTNCEVGCTSEPQIVELNRTKNEKVMLRDCDNHTGVMHFWSPADGILDSMVFPADNEIDRSNPKLIAVCTFSKINLVFECAGTAICDDARTGIDACIGGVPWRGKKKSGDPLVQGQPITGNITAYAQNSDSGAQPETNSPSALKPVKNTEKSDLAKSEDVFSDLPSLPGKLNDDHARNVSVTKVAASNIGPVVNVSVTTNHSV